MAGPRLIVEIGANSRGFDSAIKGVQGKLASFAGQIGRSFFGQYLGATGLLNVVRGLTNEFKNMLHEAREIEDLAQLFGGNIEHVQALRFAAEDTGQTFTEITSTIGKLSSAIERAVGGGKKEIAAFIEFGLSLQELKRLRVDEVFDRIRLAVQTMGATEAMSKLADLRTIGIHAKQLAMLLKDLREYDDLIKSKAALEALNKTGNAWDRIWRIIKDVKHDAFTFWQITTRQAKEPESGPLASLGSGPLSRKPLKSMIWRDITTAPGAIGGSIAQGLWGIVSAVYNKATGGKFEALPVPYQRTSEGQTDLEKRRLQLQEERKRAQDEADKALQAAMDNELAKINEQIEAEKRRNLPIRERLELLRQTLDIMEADLLSPYAMLESDAISKAKKQLEIEKVKSEIHALESGYSPEERIKEAKARQDILKADVEAKRAEYMESKDYLPPKARMGLYQGIRGEMLPMLDEITDLQVIIDRAKEKIQKNKPRTTFNQGPSQLDALARIGGFVGGAVSSNNPLLNISKEQLRQQQESNRRLAEISTNIQRLSQETSMIWT